MKGRLTYANVVGTLVLIAAIAGGTAAALPGKNSVQANDVKKNAVKARAIATGAVGADEIQDGAVTDAKVPGGSVGYTDIGNNAIVARIRIAAPISSAGSSMATPIEVPLTGNTWTQAANETDVFFADARFTKGACSGGGNLEVDFQIDGQSFENTFLGQLEPPGTHSVQAFEERPYIFETGTAVNHTATMRIHDDCTGAGEDLTLEAFDVNVIGMR